MAHQPAQSVKKPRTAVRGFFNLSVTAPGLGEAAQKDIAPLYAGAGAGLLYGNNNTVPVIAMAAAHQSGTAYRCLERRAQFLEGAGYAGPAGEEEVPGHPGKTANDAWAELCSYGAYNNGAAVLVRYRGVEGGYGIGEVHILPFGAVRKTSAGTFYLNHKFGRKGYKAADTTEHLPFNPDPKQVKREMTAARAKAKEQNKPYVQQGQIFYIYTPKAGEEDYPLPPHWPGLESVLADAAYSRFELEEVEGGFNAKGILVLKGKANDTVEGADGNTQAEDEELELGLFTDAGARAQGVRRKSILVMEAETAEAVPEWIPMGTTVDLKWLSDKKEAIGQEVCRHIGIPPILAGFAKAGQLGAVQEIINATLLTQNSLEPLRKLLQRAFWRLFPTLNGIVPGKLSPVEVAAQVA